MIKPKRQQPKKHKKMLADKQKVYHDVSRIYKELRNNQDVRFKRLKGYQGEYDFCCDEITIDYRKELLPTLIHEFIHKFYPNKSERWVLQRERFIICRLSPSQAKRLLIFLLYLV
jgi:hypothetical protein